MIGVWVQRQIDRNKEREGHTEREKVNEKDRNRERAP